MSERHSFSGSSGPLAAKGTAGLSRFLAGLEAVAFRSLFWPLEHLPLKSALWLGRFVLGAIGPLTARRKVALENIAIAFPKLSKYRRWMLMCRIFRNLGSTVVEYARVRKLNTEIHSRFDFHVSADLRQVVEGKSPAVFVLFHMGAWPLAGAFMCRYGITCTAIHAHEANPVMRLWMERLRARLPVKMLPRDRSMKTLVRELMEGNSVLILPDVLLPEGEMLPWCGTEISTITTPARLALQRNCPLVPLVVRRLPRNRYSISAGPAVRPDSGVKDRRRQARLMTTELNAIHANLVQGMPDQWYCVAPRL